MKLFIYLISSNSQQVVTTKLKNVITHQRSKEKKIYFTDIRTDVYTIINNLTVFQHVKLYIEYYNIYKYFNFPLS